MCVCWRRQHRCKPELACWITRKQITQIRKICKRASYSYI
uniref:Uncharacterized protein n=1 Tax=Anguilla anguilla TaxID=7936 RepID=A0A0E9TCU0_ANGAN